MRINRIEMKSFTKYFIKTVKICEDNLVNVFK